MCKPEKTNTKIRIKLQCHKPYKEKKSAEMNLIAPHPSLCDDRKTRGFSIAWLCLCSFRSLLSHIYPYVLYNYSTVLWRCSLLVFYLHSMCFTHWLNMELDLQSLFGLLWTAVLIGWGPATPPLPAHLDLYTRALLVSQDRRNLFVTPWFYS